MRTDIQALRAVAVTAVLIYHLWPGALSGGFVGVDVFFVISGFLITEHLLAHPPTNVRGLLEFWSRRIRRLLPAASLVLIVTVLAAWWLVPDTQWAGIASQARAAALYFVNWRLAAQSVDYLTAQSAPTPVQHFWSLSVEEQFYLGWPVLILVLVLVAGKQPTRRVFVTGLGMGLLVVLSFLYCVRYTNTVPARAYFVTPTRIWELGCGGLVALFTSHRLLDRTGHAVLRPPAWLRLVLAWGGLSAILWSSATYTGSTRFPGSHAAVPVLGAAALIAAADPAGPLSRSLAWWPVQRLGDLSYSVYLWHWPLIVLVPYVSGGQLGALDKSAIVLVSVALAAVTKRIVEDPFRKPGWGRPLAKPYALGAVAMAVVVVLTAAQTAEVQHRTQEAQQQLARALADHGPCFGAAAVANGPSRCPIRTSGSLTPPPIAASKDHSDAYADVSGDAHDCLSYPPSFPLRTCQRGDADGTLSVALFGNSHAAEWLPALERIASVQHWRITTYIVSECVASATPEVWDTAAETADCAAWTRAAQQRIAAGHYDLIVYANRIIHAATGHTVSTSRQAYEQGYVSTLRVLSASGTPVLGIRDTPFIGHDIPTCLSEHTSDYGACDGKRSDWLPNDPLAPAVKAVASDRVQVVDLDRYLCGDTYCRAQIGGVPVYFDGSHMTATYSTTMAPYLEPALAAALRVA